jgi:hypothetical protein
MTAPRPAPARFAIPPKYLSSILITIVLVVGQLVGDIVGGYDRLILALGAAVAAELVLSRLLRGRWPVLLSAYISGNSIAILTKPAGGLLWPFWMGSVLAIMSKYALTYRNRHLWNPTNFSISALLLLAPGSMSLLSHQWGNDVATWVALRPESLAVAVAVGGRAADGADVHAADLLHAHRPAHVGEYARRSHRGRGDRGRGGVRDPHAAAHGLARARRATHRATDLRPVLRGSGRDVDRPAPLGGRSATGSRARRIRNARTASGRLTADSRRQLALPARAAGALRDLRPGARR